MDKELSRIKNKQQTERGFFIAFLAVSLIIISNLVKKLKKKTRKKILLTLLII
jgi:hypothetical protein